ncbi:MAG: hypothetical protein ACT4QA_15500 [Panacagrimonas sp.]
MTATHTLHASPLAPSSRFPEGFAPNTTAPTFNTAVNTTLTVGGTADTFTTVTAPNAAAALPGVVFGVLGGLLPGLFG